MKMFLEPCEVLMRALVPTDTTSACVVKSSPCFTFSPSTTDGAVLSVALSFGREEPTGATLSQTKWSAPLALWSTKTMIKDIRTIPAPKYRYLMQPKSSPAAPNGLGSH
jgi:hypothetical protein